MDSAKSNKQFLLFVSARIIKQNGGSPPLTYKKFLAIIRSLGLPEHPVPSLDVQFLAGCDTPVSEDHEEKYGVPSLEELGLDVRNIHAEVWHGGEKEALIRLDRHLERKVDVLYIAISFCEQDSFRLCGYFLQICGSCKSSRLWIYTIFLDQSLNFICCWLDHLFFF